MPVPKQLATTAMDETFGGVTYHIEGELVPVLRGIKSTTQNGSSVEPLFDLNWKMFHQTAGR